MIKKFDKFNVTTYHGGKIEKLRDIYQPIFTTTDKEAAVWYAESSIGWITTLSVTIENPLICSNKEDFKEKWMPILEDAGIDYTFNEYEKNNSWSFESIDILRNGGHIENNLNDLIYIPSFVESAKKFGYDGIEGHDEFFQGDIYIYIPFYKKNIKIIKTEKF